MVIHNSKYNVSYCTQDAEIECENKGWGEKVHHLKGDKNFVAHMDMILRTGKD